MALKHWTDAVEGNQVAAGIAYIVIPVAELATEECDVSWLPAVEPVHAAEDDHSLKKCSKGPYYDEHRALG